MLNMAKNFRCVETKLIHAGEPEPRIEGAVIMPIFQTAMFEYAGETDYNALRYIRLNNTPNHLVLHEKLAALENGEAALVTASGMAAISSALLTVLSAEIISWRRTACMAAPTTS
jgi:cystathionine beta-lyase/cystathionine gamma-synthase